MHPFERKRLAMGLNQPEAAAKLNVDQSTISRWEKGECIPEARMFPRIAKLFKMSPEEVTYLFDAPQPAAA